MALLTPGNDTPGAIRRVGARRPGPTAPNGEIMGDLWYDTANLTLNVWNGTNWQLVAASGPSVGTNVFYNGLELYHPASTPFIDFHRAVNPAGDGSADYNMRIINNTNGYLEVFGGRVRVGWAEMGTHPVHTSYAWFGRTAQAGGSDYAFLTNGSESIINAVDTSYMSRGGSWIARANASGFTVNSDMYAEWKLQFRNQVRDDVINLYPSDYMLGIRSQTLFLTTNLWLSMDSRSSGANRTFDWHAYDGIYLRNSAWYRTQGGGGFYLADALWGLKSAGGGGRTATTENNECRLIIERISQGGWATSAIENRGGSGSVPQYAFHANGERANQLRKDNGGWNGVWVDQNSNCASFFSAGFGTCSDEARKTDIAVFEDIGLKTIRGLVPKTYRYHPVTEDQIWSTMKDRQERADGKWKYRVGQQESWEQVHVGYMAEEIYNRFPLAAFLDPIDERPWAIDYGKLVIAAISAINELADKVEELEAQLEKERVNA